MFLTTTGLVVRGLGGWAQAHIKYDCALAQTAVYCASGRRFDYGARGFNVNALLPLVEFSNDDANQKFPFLFFAFRRRGGGRSRAKKMQGNFWVCPRESASVSEAHWFASQRNWSVRGSFKSPRAPRVRSGFAQRSIHHRKQKTSFLFAVYS